MGSHECPQVPHCRPRTRCGGPREGARLCRQVILDSPCADEQPMGHKGRGGGELCWAGPGRGSPPPSRGDRSSLPPRAPTLTPRRPESRARPPRPPGGPPRPQRSQQPPALPASFLGRAHRCPAPSLRRRPGPRVTARCHCSRRRASARCPAAARRGTRGHRGRSLRRGHPARRAGDERRTGARESVPAQVRQAPPFSSIPRCVCTGSVPVSQRVKSAQRSHKANEDDSQVLGRLLLHTLRLPQNK